jgi:starvation-inducible DNA-binding protein
MLKKAILLSIAALAIANATSLLSNFLSPQGQTCYVAISALAPQGEDDMETTATFKHLSTLLADTAVLAAKTQNYHWNIQDPRFAELHKFFDVQYNELNLAKDVIAEQIRGLDQKAPATFKAFLELSQLSEDTPATTGNEMIAALYDDNATIAKNLGSAIKELSSNNDQGSVDVMIERQRAHQKAAWMLKSHLTQ